MSGELSWWLRQASRYPLLTAQQELTLGRLIQAWQQEPEPSPAVEKRGRRARDRLVTANLRLVVVVARRYHQHVSSAMGFGDLVQGGNMGLIRAAQKYDPARGYRFTTYAYWWISQGVCAVVDRESRTIRMPTTFAPRLQQLGKATTALVGQLGREPTRQELADALGMRREDLDAVMLVGSRPSSLDRLRADDEGDTFLEVLAAPEDPTDEHLEELRDRLAQLPHTLAALVEGAYGIDRLRVSARELAREHGATPAEIKARLALALRLLGVGPNGPAPPPLLPDAGDRIGEQLRLVPAGCERAPCATAVVQTRRAGRRAALPSPPAQQLGLPLC